jgi:type I restriction enzyme M protein
MNLYLHGIEPVIWLGDSIYEPARAARFDIVLTNPPFGTKGANQAPEREDFTVSTSNKQLNFIQHVLTILKPGGRAAVVLPDNCLFADKAGEVFKILTEDCDLHTVLRLPRGTFTPYSAGVKANVAFFVKGLSDRDCMDLRRPYQCRRNYEKGQTSDSRAFRRVREVLRQGPQRAIETQRQRFGARPVAQLPRH